MITRRKRKAEALVRKQRKRVIKSSFSIKQIKTWHNFECIRRKETSFTCPGIFPFM